MDILGGASLVPGLVVLADQQTLGRGRGGNLWISPPGCAMFSLQLQLNLVSNMGAKPSLIQHIVGLAVAETLRSFHNQFEVRLKWPNDIYYKDQVKLGGVIANSSFLGSTIIVNIGCGVNLNNLEPTISVNNILSGLGSAPISREAYLSVLFNTLENLIDLYNQGNQDILFQRYYKYWLHENQEIKLEIEPENSQNKCSRVDIVKIVGLDEFGYLRVMEENGHEFSVHDDRNSFDMTKGLIRPKFS
ncbi:biotin--protein ligase [Eurytemora carolleeae]|uniref:biotin--protein ligase n=1 Tax=Eurytemora carolleeae TaxID=1294199 RepID=UPI000C768D22|nr:biotin--protein ligase [Eurytemora carolleeae]|eukprot:XP_023345768.1 biotin--protein ligase-like [Eurytemora affinis]